MSYTKTVWRNNQAPAINADNLNHIEQGIESAHNQMAINTSDIETLTTQVQGNANNIASEISARQSGDSLLQSQIDQIIAPTGEAPSAAEVENARIGDDGITYDTLGNAIRGQFSDVKSEINGYFSDVSFTEISGSYVNHLGQISTLATFSRSQPIQVYAGQVYRLRATGYSTVVAMISTCNSDGSSIAPVVLSTDSNEQIYEYTAINDGYIMISYDNRALCQLVNINIFKTSDATSLASDVNTVETAIGVNLSNIAQTALLQTGKFVSFNSSLSDNANLNIYGPITLNKGEQLYFNAKGYQTYVAILAKKNSDNTYTPLIISEDSNNRNFEYIATDNMDVVISSNKDTVPAYRKGVVRVVADIEDLKHRLSYDVFAFNSMGIIGDSLASGASNYPKSGGDTTPNDRKEYSWGKYIEREHGVDVELYSEGGTNTRTWLTRASCIGVFNSDTPRDCYCIGLGVNDAYSLGAAYLGTVADVHVGAESDNPDTFYGNYSKIIGLIKTKSPYSKIFCFTDPKANDQLELDYNQAIRDIVALYDNAFLIDLYGDEFYNSSEFTNYWYLAHSTAIGYKVMAGHIWQLLNEYIRNNYSDFLDIQWITY